MANVLGIFGGDSKWEKELKAMKKREKEAREWLKENEDKIDKSIKRKKEKAKFKRLDKKRDAYLEGDD